MTIRILARSGHKCWSGWRYSKARSQINPKRNVHIYYSHASLLQSNQRLGMFLIRPAFTVRFVFLLHGKEEKGKELNNHNMKSWKNLWSHRSREYWSTFTYGWISFKISSWSARIANIINCWYESWSWKELSNSLLKVSRF